MAGREGEGLGGEDYGGWGGRGAAAREGEGECDEVAVEERVRGGVGEGAGEAGRVAEEEEDGVDAAWGGEAALEVGEKGIGFGGEGEEVCENGRGAWFAGGGRWL